MKTSETLQKPDAVVIIDATRAFFPASEGERLQQPGFGELPVETAPEIIAPLNEITIAALRNAVLLYNASEAHPDKTAHFSETPNFKITWPGHSKFGEAGSLLHPRLLLAQYPAMARFFLKGTEAIDDPSQDTSYTAALAREIDPRILVEAYAQRQRLGKAILKAEEITMGGLLPEEMRKDNVKHAVIGGIALGDEEALLCVGSTIRDFREQGFETTLLTDAVASITPEAREGGLEYLEGLGVRMATTAEVIAVMDTREGAKS